MVVVTTALGETKKSEILAQNEKSSITKTWRDAALWPNFWLFKNDHIWDSESPINV